MQILLDHAVSLLYRPKYLARLTKGSSITSQTIKDPQSVSEDDAFEDEVKAMNE